jgi:hypothetical protein
MDDSYIFYRIKWAVFFISIFIPALVAGMSSAGVIVFMAGLIMGVLLLFIIVTMIGMVVWVFWHVISVLWYMMKQIIQAISDKSMLTGSQKTISAARLHRAPGANLLLIVTFLYPPKAVEEIFKPLVADWRMEYFDALKQGQTIKACWISCRYIYSFIVAIGLSKVFSIVRRLAGR